MKKISKVQNYNFDKICIMGMLRRADIIPTKQRVALASLMFDSGKRHFTAEKIHEEAIVSDLNISLGTICNVPFYMNRNQYSRWEHTNLVVDLVDGMGGMFSLDNGTGKRFLIRSEVCTVKE